jgi:Sulfotransferase domain
MWLFNVTREIYRSMGRKVEPSIVPQTNEEIFQVAKTALTSQDPSKVWVLKIHNYLKQNLPKTKIITVHRDPRDVLISYKEFMNCSFDDALHCARDVVRYTKAYENYDSNYLLSTAYDEIINQPEELILKIASFLKVTINKDNAKEIALKFSRENVKIIIKNSEARLANNISSNKSIDWREVILTDTNYRVFDPNTGFHSRHISQYQTGDWKNILSKSEQQRLDSEFGNWLKMYGYEK